MFLNLIVFTRGGVEDTRLEAKDTKKIRGQGQGHKRSALHKKKKGLHKNFFSDLQKKKKRRSSQKFFKRSPQKNVFQKNFQALHKILTIQKIVLFSSRGQANFRGLEASRPRTSKCVLEAKDVLEDSTSGRPIYNLTNSFTKLPWQRDSDEAMRSASQFVSCLFPRPRNTNFALVQCSATFFNLWHT